MLYVLGFLNSKISQKCIKILNPTITTQVGDMARIPVYFEKEKKEKIDLLVDDSVNSVRTDWDSFENSWDFQHHPLLRKVLTIAEAFDQWQAECDNRFNQLKANEEELNRIFIDIYGLQDELTPEVEDKDVTVRKADLGRDTRSFISLGGLLPGLSPDDIRSGISQPRNKNLAEVFHRLRLIESYGTGIRRIFNLYAACSEQPQIEVTSNTFKIVLPNMNTVPVAESENIPAVTTQMQKVLDYIKANGQITEKGISELLGLKKTRTFIVAKQMRDLGLIKVVGRGDSKKYLLK